MLLVSGKINLAELAKFHSIASHGVVIAFLSANTRFLCHVLHSGSFIIHYNPRKVIFYRFLTRHNTILAFTKAERKGCVQTPEGCLTYLPVRGAALRQQYIREAAPDLHHPLHLDSWLELRMKCFGSCRVPVLDFRHRKLTAAWPCHISWKRDPISSGVLMAQWSKPWQSSHVSVGP